MGFEEVVAKESAQKDFGSERYARQYRARSHISISKVDEFGSSVYVGTDGYTSARYSESAAPAYIAAKGLSYDWVVTLYDINSNTGGMWRSYKADFMQEMETFMKQLPRSADVEARIIGLQDDQDTAALKKTLSFLNKHKITLMEADLFGDEIRHVAFDLKRGMTFDILLENRIYRPGELKNAGTADQFEAQLRTELNAKPGQ